MTLITRFPLPKPLASRFPLSKPPALVGRFPLPPKALKEPDDTVAARSPLPLPNLNLITAPKPNTENIKK